MVTKRPLGRPLFSFAAVLFLLLSVSAITYAFTLNSQVSPKAQNTPPVVQIQKSTLIVGSEQDFPPFATGMTDETAGGFTVELWKAVAEEAGLNYSIRVLPFHELLQEFKAGKIDVLINFNVTDEAHAYADFSVPHAIFNGGIFIRNDELNIHSEADLNGKSIIMMKDDVEAIYTSSRGWDKQLVLVETTEEGMRLLASGKHDAMLINKIVGLQTLRKLGLTNIKALKVDAGFTQKFAFAVHEGQSELLGRINEGLAVAKANNTYDTIYEKWFGVYEVQKISLFDFLKYLIPIALMFMAVLGYSFYRRHIEQNLATKALLKSESLLRLSQNSGGIGCWEADLVNKTQVWSDNCYALLGISILNQPTWNDFLAVVHPEDRQLVIDATQSHIEHNTVYDVEYRTISANGDIHWLRSTGQVERSLVGEPTFMRGTVQDVTEHKQQLKTIQDAEARWAFAVEGAGDGVWEWNVSTGSMLRSRINDAMLGYDAQELPQTVEAWLEIIHPDDLQDNAKRLQNYLAGVTASYAMEMRLRCKDGGYSWVLCRGTIVERDSEGKPLRMIGIHTNITERKIAENSLRIAAIAFESQEGVMITDANRLILRVNSAFTSITGYGLEEVEGKNPRILSSGKQNASFYADMWQKINATDTWEGEIWNRRKNGEIYPEYLTITAVKDSNKAVTNYVGTLTDITLRKVAEEKIQSLAFYDPLTQLPNRRLLLDRLNQALAASARSGQRGALLFLDLDQFKVLNDTLGHDMGDLLLQQVGVRLTSSVREGDTVARIGGDEFVVLLEDLSEHAIEAAAQTKDVAVKIIMALNPPYSLNAHSYHNTSSIGATLFNGHELNIDELLKQADIAMYQAKMEGRNTLRFFDPKMQEAINVRVDTEHELRKAIEQGQFQLHYQIQVGSSGQALGAEALVRWVHPERGMISPFNFIPLAEDTGLILPIGQWVLNAACAQLQLWQRNKLTKDLVLAVNVSAKQFHQEDFVGQVIATIQSHDVNPARLKIELTESMLVNDIDDIITKMNALSEIGIRFSLDDFGTGYSSLQYLKKLPLNQLKIDQSFVRDIVTDSSDRAIVRTIITMASNLDINVIAEGVETAEQQQFLLDNGCTHYQGYLFSKPLPIDEFEMRLRKN